MQQCNNPTKSTENARLWNMLLCFSPFGNKREACWHYIVLLYSCGYISTYIMCNQKRKKLGSLAHPLWEANDKLLITNKLIFF